MCDHQNFLANVNVARLEDTKQFVADITIKCKDCNAKFQFLGLQPGLNIQGATVSIDGLEARLGICPEGSKPNPLQNMQFSINRFDA